MFKLNHAFIVAKPISQDNEKLTFEPEVLNTIDNYNKYTHCLYIDEDLTIKIVAKTGQFQLFLTSFLWQQFERLKSVTSILINICSIICDQEVSDIHYRLSNIQASGSFGFCVSLWDIHRKTLDYEKECMQIVNEPYIPLDVKLSSEAVKYLLKTVISLRIIYNQSTRITIYRSGKYTLVTDTLETILALERFVRKLAT